MEDWFRVGSGECTVGLGFQTGLAVGLGCSCLASYPRPHIWQASKKHIKHVPGLCDFLGFRAGAIGRERGNDSSPRIKETPSKGWFKSGSDSISCSLSHQPVMWPA